MAVTWQASGTLLGSTGADITPVNPAHIADDILVLQAAARSNAVTLATPSGWTAIAGPIDQGTTWRTYWFYKRAAGSAEANPLCDWSAVTGDKYGVVHNLRGAKKTGSPFAATATTAGTADPGSATGVTTTVANQYVASIGMSGDNVATGFTSLTGTDPASYTVHDYTTITTGADAGKWLADATRATAGATGALSHDFNGAPLVWSILVAAVIAYVTTSLTPATLALSGVAVDPDPGMVTVGLTSATLVLSSVAVDADPGPVSVALTPASLALMAVALDPAASGGTIDLIPAVMALGAVAVDPDPGPVSLTLTPAVLALGPLALDPDPGPVTLALTPAPLSFSAVALDPQGSGGAGGTVLLTPAPLILSSVALDPEPGPVATSLTPAVISLTAQPLLLPDDGGLTVSVVINLTSPGFIPIVTGIGACIVEALDQTPAGAPDRQCLLLPTAVIPWDDCDCGGQVALAIRQVFGSNTFPAPAVPNDWHKCGPRFWVADVLVSVTRCITPMNEQGTPPGCDVALGEAIRLENDRTAVRQAIACCLEQIRDARPPLFPLQAWRLDSSVTLGEQGACAGIETTFLMGVAACACPQG